MTIKKELIDLANQKSKLEREYRSVVADTIMRQKPMENDEFWPVVDALAVEIGFGRGVESACHNLICHQVYRHPASEQPARWLRMCSFLRRYTKLKAVLFNKMDDMRGLERGDDSYGDLIDSMPLAGRKVFEDIFGDEVATYAQLRRATSDNSLQDFILNGENYIEMRLEEKIIDAFLSIARELGERDDTDFVPRHPCVQLVGDPINGFQVYGPFNGRDEAKDWGNGVSTTSWIYDLKIPVL